MKSLLEHGAHANVTDEEGDTALHWAVREGRLGVIPLLIQYGASADLPNDDGETPLQLACCLGEQEIVEILTPSSKTIRAMEL